jgi:phosphatidyl-myo-inositol dimannoside synthase
MTARTLVVTNDFPPRPGGIQTFVHELVRREPAEQVVVFTSRHDGWEAFDEAADFTVVRADARMLLPTRSARAQAVHLLKEHDCDRVLFGAAAPLGLLAPALRAAGARRLVAMTHGHEAAWAQLPAARKLMRRIGDGVDVVTYLGEYTHQRIGAALSPDARACMQRLAPGVDSSVFTPEVNGSEVRARYGLTGRPVVVCVSRLMPRKGQDTLIRAFAAVRARVPDAALLLVGGGPIETKLRSLAESLGLQNHVVITGSVSWPELPNYYRAGDVFAMPCRTRRRGMDVEGLGIVYLEASASGLPVVAGDSGGAPDAVKEGETGFVVDGRDLRSVAEPIIRLLLDERLRTSMGRAGRSWVEADWRWDSTAERLAEMLDPQISA